MARCKRADVTRRLHDWIAPECRPDPAPELDRGRVRRILAPGAGMVGRSRGGASARRAALGTGMQLSPACRAPTYSRSRTSDVFHSNRYVRRRRPLDRHHAVSGPLASRIERTRFARSTRTRGAWNCPWRCHPAGDPQAAGRSSRERVWPGRGGFWIATTVHRLSVTRDAPLVLRTRPLPLSASKTVEVRRAVHAPAYRRKVV